MSDPSQKESRIVRSEDISDEEHERRIAESIARLEAMTDDDIDFSDIPETTPEQWARAIPNPFYRPVWQSATVQLDRFVLDWFEMHHHDDSKAINAALMGHIRRERMAKPDH